MKKYGLIGWPVSHSISPPMQNAGFRAIGVNASYDLYPIEPKKLAKGIEQLKELNLSGWNITVPHKTAMLELVDWIEPSAKAAASINTVKNIDGQLKAWSTDGYGLEKSILESYGLTLKGNIFSFIGTGGAARATAMHFAAHGAKELHLINRTISKAESLAEDILKNYPQVSIQVCSTASEKQKKLLQETDVCIQSTSLGLEASDPLPVAEQYLYPGLRILDMIYKPTALQKVAKQRGCNVVSGLGMLLYQGVRSFEIWNDLNDGPAEAMLEGLKEAIL